MKNEQHTETLVSEQMNFRNGKNEWGYVYPQGNTEGFVDVENLLKKAGGKPKECDLSDYSLGGKGKAKPEFIIHMNGKDDTIIVIEAKNTISKHESVNKNQPNAYAVDGVLYYAKFLKEKFNVIAIAVSGTSLNKYKTSTFKWNKGEDNYTEWFQGKNNFLTINNIINILDGNKIKREYNEQEVQELALKLHDNLRILGVTEKEKPLFIASILIALNNQEFLDIYHNFTTPVQLIRQVKEYVEIELDKADIPNEKIKYLKSSLDQLGKNEKIKSIELRNENSIRWYIEQLENKILPMMNYTYNTTGDALGKFYHEFIKYSGGDGKGLGIVLTPKHITDFMVEVAKISKTDKVLDPACGSGSFLVSAMNKMFEQAQTEEDEEEIKKNNLHGIEINTDLWVLAMTNMIVRGDGKSNINSGSCFDEKTIKKIKEEKINKGLINPPYSQKDYSEIEFIDNMLDMLTVGGIGVAIVPLSSAIGTKFKEEREVIMSKHTLKAVFSMPDDLFYPTASTNTCVMVWEAHKSHEETNEETFFGFYKDDGFVKKKKLGRVDSNNKWNEIKDQWLNAYKRNKIVDGFTAEKKVTHEDEWLVEAYMKTDYSNLKEEDFINTLQDYMAFLVTSGDSDE